MHHTHEAEQGRELAACVSLALRWLIIPRGKTYRLLLGEVTGSTEDDDDGVVLELNGTGAAEVSTAASPNKSCKARGRTYPAFCSWSG